VETSRGAGCSHAADDDDWASRSLALLTHEERCMLEGPSMAAGRISDGKKTGTGPNEVNCYRGT
jgi:hypothetical protein